MDPSRATPTIVRHTAAGRWRIRELQDRDRAAAVDLWVASWREAMPDPDFEARRGWIAEVLADPAHTVLVAAGKVPLGFAALCGSVLSQLVVAPAAKGGGVASALLDAAKARSPSGLDLDVNADNARAVRFYLREGFVRTAEGINPTSGLATWHMAWRQSPRSADS